jgi:hypothetical protein
MTAYTDFYKELGGVFRNHPQPCSGHMIRPVPAKYIRVFKKRFCREELFIYISLIKITFNGIFVPSS